MVRGICCFCRRIWRQGFVLLGGLHPPSIDGEQGENREQKRGREAQGEVKSHPRILVDGEKQPEENDRSEGDDGPVNQEGKPTKPAQSGAQHEAGDYHKAVANDRREKGLIQDRSNMLKGRTSGSRRQW
jgi:hypothetical protein